MYSFGRSAANASAPKMAVLPVNLCFARSSGVRPLNSRFPLLSSSTTSLNHRVERRSTSPGRGVKSRTERNNRSRRKSHVRAAAYHHVRVRRNRWNASLDTSSSLRSSSGSSGANPPGGRSRHQRHRRIDESRHVRGIRLPPHHSKSSSDYGRSSVHSMRVGNYRRAFPGCSFLPALLRLNRDYTAVHPYVLLHRRAGCHG